MLQIGLASAQQHESLVDLLCELYAHYNEESTVARQIVRTHLLENLLAADSPLRLVVALRPDGGVVGFAAIALLYSLVDPTPEKRRQCLVKELFVRSSARGQGVGRALMAWVARHAVERGCSRIDWPVNAANRGGIAFYEGLGAEHVAERLSYRLSGLGMDRLAGESHDENEQALADKLFGTDPNVKHRLGTADDAVCISVLATHVFLDTYAVDGVRPDLAREVLAVCAPSAFELRVTAEETRFLLAEVNGHLVGFAELARNNRCPVPSVFADVELVRLYVHPAFQRKGIGRGLLQGAEKIAEGSNAKSLWLTVWTKNSRALAFYRGLGYDPVGTTDHLIEARAYENQVFFKSLAGT